MIVNIILFYETKEQETVDIEINENIYQLDFIIQVFKLLKPNELKELALISCSPYENNIIWLDLEYKYYFDKDEDEYWYNIKQLYIKHKNKIYKKIKNYYITASYKIGKYDYFNKPLEITNIKSRNEFIELVNNNKPSNRRVKEIICFKQYNIYIEWFSNDYLTVK